MASMTGTDVIKLFGGLGPVSQITGANRRAVEQWKRIGVPSKYWPELVSAADEKGIEGITFDVLRATKSQGSVAA